MVNISDLGALTVVNIIPTKYYHEFYTYSSTNTTVLKRQIYDNSSTLIYSVDLSFGGMNISNVLALLDDNGTTPYTIGIVDPSMNKVQLDLAYTDVFRKAFRDTEKTKLITYVNKTYKEPHTIADGLYTIRYANSLFEVKNSSNAIVSNPISLTSGNVYIFDQSDTSNTGTTLRLLSPINIEITSGVTKYGTPGTLNAYTMVSPLSAISVYFNTPTVAYTTYTVTSVDNLFVVKNSSNANVSEPIALITGNMYVFHQSDTSNTGKPLRLLNSFTTEITSGVTKYGTPGTTNAYMIISPSSNLSVFCNISSIVITNFTVTYANTFFIVKDSTDTIMNYPITLSAGNVYKFNQSESSNSGTTFKLFNSSNTEITSDIIKNGTPGTLNAYTMISPSSTISVYSNIRTPVIANVTGSTTTQNNVDGYKVIQFTTVGTYDVSFNKTLNIEVLVVAGGGGGGYQCGGGGGAGGVIYNNSYGVTSNTNITVTVGAGGTGSPGSSAATNGGNSVCGTLTANGGGRGGSSNGGLILSTGKSGGSGGGSCFSNGIGSVQGGVGTTGQGFNGGSSYSPYFSAFSDVQYSYSGGGGGAGSVGGNAVQDSYSGGGGNGVSYSITGNSVIYGGGGGGGGNGIYTYGKGGLGGGGNGKSPGTNGLGGGGGGGGYSLNVSNIINHGANGGSGVVIIRYPVYT